MLRGGTRPAIARAASGIRSVMEALRSLDQPQFRMGAAVALGCVAGVLVLRAVVRRRAPRASLPVGGLVVAAATLPAMDRQPELLVGVILVGGLVGAASVVGDRRLAFAASIPGAIVVAVASTRPPSAIWWWPIAGGVVVLGWLLADFEGRHREGGLPPSMLAVSCAGLYLAVPDTEAAAALFGGSLIVAACGWLGLVSLGTAGSAVAVATFLAVAAEGGRSLAPSVLGGGACIGLMALEPLAVLWHRRPGGRAPSSSVSTLPVLAAHALVVAIASRVAGQAARLDVAAVVVIGDGLLAFALAVALFGGRGRGEGSAPGEGNSEVSLPDEDGHSV